MKSFLSKHFLLHLMVFVLVFAGTSCSKDDEPKNNPTSSGPQNVLEVAKSSSDMTLFAEAVAKTNLSSTLNSGTNLTLFVPTNTVFSAFLADLGYNDVDAWLTVAKQEVVQQMLLYHILNDQFAAADLATGYAKTKAQNDNGNNLDLYVNTSSGTTLNDNNVAIVESDIEASNGVIHKVNGVLQPQSIGDLINNNPDFNAFKTASGLAQTNVINTLSTPNTSFTLLAPNNGAFNQFYSERSDISNPLDMLTVFGDAGLQNLLEFHIILGNVRANQFSTQSYPTRFSGHSVNIINSGGNLSISDAQGRQAFFLFKDVSATNGSLHIITNVLLNN